MPFQIVRDKLDEVWCDAVVDTSMRVFIKQYSQLLNADSLQTTDGAKEEYDTIGTIGIGEYELRRPNRQNCHYTINTSLPDE